MVTQLFLLKTIRLWRIVFFILCCYSCSEKAKENKQGTDTTYHYISNTHGKIKQIVVKTWMAMDSSDAYYRGLAEVFDTSEIIRIDKPLKRNGKPLYEGELRFWVHDQFHTLQSYSNPPKIKLIYSDYSSTNVKSVKRFTSQFTYIETGPALHYKAFEAGNFIASENYLLIGQNTFYYNYNDTSISISVSEKEYRNSFETELKELFNVKHIIWAGYEEAVFVPGQSSTLEKHQPIFHLDMFLTPAGQRSNKNLVYIGQIDKALYNPGYLDKRRMEIIDSLNLLIRKTANSLKQYCNNYHLLYPNDTTLKDFIFDTIPLAAQFGTKESNDFYLVCNFKSLNNALVEIMQKEKNVYLSDYIDSGYINVCEMKRKAETKYSDAGFNVHFLQPAADGLNNGALHCYAKVIWRDRF